MRWTNPVLVKAKNYDADHFTSDFGIKLRRLTHPFVHFLIKNATDKSEISIDSKKRLK